MLNRDSKVQTFDRVRKDVSHKLAGAKNKLTTQFDLRIGDMVSYRGAAVKILQLMHPSKHGFSKALVRTVTHDSDSTDTVNFTDLTPLGDVRPELMVPRDIDMSHGRLVFFEVHGRIDLETSLMSMEWNCRCTTPCRQTRNYTGLCRYIRTQKVIQSPGRNLTRASLPAPHV